MKKEITCPNCRQHYVLDSSEIDGSDLYVTCEKCGTDFSIVENMTDITKESVPKKQKKKDIAGGKPQDSLITSWKSIVSLITIETILCAFVFLFAIANSKDGNLGVVLVITMLVTILNLHILGVLAKTIQRTLERQNQTKEHNE